nr:MAG TPA_asm: hypothetical protein [Caudoviricetes sp.]
MGYACRFSAFLSVWQTCAIMQCAPGDRIEIID